MRVRRRKSRSVFKAGVLPALLACLLAAAPAQERGGRDDEPLRLHSDLVLVSVTVTDADGKYAHGLRADDFQLFEDDRPQKVASFHAEEAPFAAAILIDMSASMGYKFGLVRAAAATFLEQIRDDDQVAVYGFNDKVHLMQEFSSLRQITDYVWDARAENKTRLYDCLSEAVDALAGREERRRAVLLISDGGDTASRKSSYDAALKKALAAGVTVYAVDLIEDDAARGSASEMLLLRRGKKEMQSLALETGGRYIAAPTGDGLDQSFAQVVDELSNQYTLSYYSTNERRDGRWRKIQVQVGQTALKARARRGYYAPKDGK